MFKVMKNSLKRHLLLFWEFSLRKRSMANIFRQTRSLTSKPGQVLNPGHLSDWNWCMLCRHNKCLF